MKLCPSENDLTRLLAEELSPEKTEATVTHVEECAECQIRLEHLTESEYGEILSGKSGHHSQNEQINSRELFGALASSLALADTETCEQNPARSTSCPEIPGYEILSELGCGGMGVVYEARQINLNRRVALKTLRSQLDVSPEQRLRFQAEAETIARLHHPNIIEIHELGSQDNQPWFALELMEGGTLSERIRAGLPTPKQAASLVLTLAEAIQYAHEQGIIHRDLKPANILFETRGTFSDQNDHEPRITDFGLARHQDSGLDLTRSGIMLGTPAYVAPEQARARHDQIGPATDVHALGVLLYELTTGGRPFWGATELDVLDQVVMEEPQSPRRLNAQIPLDLETICLKCLQKEPAKRYGSAQALADDLRSFLEGKPIVARPVRRWERLVRWSRRNPTLASLTATVASLLLALLIGSVAFAIQKNQSVRDLKEANRLANDHAAHATLRAAESRYLIEKLYVATGQRLAEDGKLSEALLWFARPLQKHHGEMISEEMHRRRLGAYLRYGGIPTLQHVLIHPDVRSPYVYEAEHSPVGDWMITRPTGRLCFWSNDTGLPVGRAIELKGNPRSMLISPDGRWVSTSTFGGTTIIWDSKSRAQHRRFEGRCLAFSPDGARVALAKNGPTFLTIQIRDVVTGKVLSPLERFPQKIQRGFFGPERFHIVTESYTGEIQLWHAFPKKAIGPPIKCFCERVLDISQDGRRALVMTSSLAQVWDLVKGKKIGKALQHWSSVRAGRFDRSGRRVYTSTTGYSARVWDASTGSPLTPWLESQHTAERGSFSPDGSQVVIPSFDGTAKAWHIRSPRGKQVKFAQKVDQISIHPIGRVLGRGNAGVLLLLDPVSGKTLHQHSVGKVRAISSNGRYFVSDEGRGTLQVREMSTGRSVGQPIHQRGALSDISSDGRYLLMGNAIWSVSTGKQRGGPIKAPWPIHSASFAPNGKVIALTAVHKGKVQLWDIATERPMKDSNWLGQSTVIQRGSLKVSFSPDSRFMVVYGSPEKSARVYNVETGKPVGPVMKHPARNLRGSRLTKAVFSQDGRFLVTCAPLDLTARVWEVATGLPLGPPLRHAAVVEDVAFTLNANHVMTVSSGEIRLWDISPDQRPRKDLVKLTEVLHGHRLDQYGALIPMTPTEQHTELKSLKKKYGRDFQAFDSRERK